MKITTKRCTLCEAYHAEKDGKEFQVEVRLEDGTANDPKKCTVIIDGEEATTDVKDGEDALKKAIKAGAEKLGFKIVEAKNEDAELRLKVGILKDKLSAALARLQKYDISDYVIAAKDHPDEYVLVEGMRIPLDDSIEFKYASEVEEGCKSAKGMLQEKFDKAKAKALRK